MTYCDEKPEGNQQTTTAPVRSESSTPVFLAPRIPIVFCGSGPYIVEGPHTGEMYYFSPRKAEQLIDAEDAAVLIETGVFRKKTVSDQIAALVPVALQTSQQLLQRPHAEEPTEN